MADEDEPPTVLPTEADASQPPTPVDVRSVALSAIAVLGGIAILRWAQPVLIPVVLGILISYVLSPAVRSMVKRGMPRALAALLVIAMLCGAGGVAIYTLSDDAVGIVQDLPRAAENIRRQMNERRRPRDPSLLEKMQEAASQIDKTAAKAADAPPAPTGVTPVQIVPAPFNATDYLWASGRGVIRFLGQLAMVLFLVYFLLVTDDLYKRKIVKIAGPTLTKKKISVQIMDEINQQISNFLRVQVLTSAIVALATGTVLWWFGLNNYVIWGLLAGIFNSIPYLGPIIVSGGLATVAFLQFDDMLRTLYVSGSALVITSLEGWLLTPLLMSRAAQMNPVAIFVGLLFWSWVWGVWGTILAVPMLTTLKAVCDRIEDLQPIGELLGE
jgi:predicted PurR-regulated permease PerM